MSKKLNKLYITNENGFYLDILKFEKCVQLVSKSSESLETPESKDERTQVEEYIKTFIINCYKELKENFSNVINIILLYDCVYALECVILYKYDLFMYHKEKIILDSVQVYFSSRCIKFLKDLKNRHDLIF